MSHKQGIAVLGFGRMGGVHVKNLMASPRASIKWIVRNKLEDAKKFIDSFGLAASCTGPDDLDPMLKDPSVDAVVICSPTSSHESQIKKALEAGKAVFCEKPITRDRATTKQLYALAKKHNKPLFCAFHRRFDPSFQAMRESIHSGKLGNLRLLKGSSHDTVTSPLSYIKTSGGILNDSTIHDLDMSMWMVGSRPEIISVHGNAFNSGIRDCGDCDLVVVTIKYQNGVISVIDNGRQATFGYIQNMEAVCDKGCLKVTNRETSYLHKYSLDMLKSPNIDYDFVTRYPEAYHNEMEHFLNVLQGKAQLGITEEDTLRAMALVEAGNASLKSGKPVIVDEYDRA
ncbi:uncharacterized oxidoreductase YrbE-like [Gigantopelta aegis]|uniref:uncharacterized oxidoreductase YrbE-like n=1 Tax=Gigantopelta aegis TaxID=1735272 RepID=UPI001B888E3D|nr:uncharacterized oxidoreductase YrbE-like [Gigantopelta aegis]XP_041351712.1 uncharacterized oxidoreductase YrbE-like [Gigantopelta aegis]XP_041351721.1 uncharacterized oxidoreductase YrbE-like [Gigantopelta aegis]